jgi:hypothetical protein
MERRVNKLSELLIGAAKYIVYVFTISAAMF